MARERVDELTAERVLLAAGNEQANKERDTLAARDSKLEAAAATYEGELGAVVQTVRSWEVCVAVPKDCANTAKAPAPETL